MTWAGYILGFPTDTPESIRRDIEIIKKELPIDILEFFCLTPLPGSEDHKKLHVSGVAMDPDMNNYDLEHVCTAHAKMSAEEWAKIYRDAWDIYYTDEHVETVLRRAFVVRHSHEQGDRGADVLLRRRADRGRASAAARLRAAHRPHAAAARHAARQSADLLSLAGGVFVREVVNWLSLYRRYSAIEKRVRKDPNAKNYTDQALAPVSADPSEDHLVEIFADKIPQTYGAPTRPKVAAAG